MFTGIDHIVILVQRLDDAIRTYQGLGFNVYPGGEHPGGTHNALVIFQDGAYLELIAFQRPDRPHDHRWYRFLSTGGGIVDFAVGVDDVAATVERARAAGLDYRGPVPGARRRLDGVEVAWRLGVTAEDFTGEMPFVIDDVTPREVRVPTGDVAVHPLGVVGLRSVVVAVRDLGEAAERYGALLGVTPPAAVADDALMAQTVTFDIGPHQIVLAYPSDPGSPLVRRIQRQGDGPWQIVLTAEGRDTPLTIEPSQAEGARIVIEPV